MKQFEEQLKETEQLRLQIAKNMKQQGFSIDFIINVTNFTKERIEKL